MKKISNNSFIPRIIDNIASEKTESVYKNQKWCNLPLVLKHHNLLN